MAFKYDFSGYATKNDLRCSDGRIIRAGAFADQDGMKVPLVWNHDHRNMENVVGHALLENRDDGVYAYGVFNETPNGLNAKQLVEHGDICAMSIYANKLKQSGSDVLHGVIRELSLVYAGANPGAFIDSVITHEDGADEEAIIYTGEEIDISHGEVADAENTAKQSNGGETVADVWETFTDDEKNVVYAIIGDILSEKEDSEKSKITNDETDDEEEKTMKHNAFDTDIQKNPIEGVLTHSDQTAILDMAKSPNCGSLRAAMAAYSEDCDHLQHGIDEIETLFPDYKDVKPGAPELLTDELAWVTKVMNGVHKSPISRIRTRQVDARGRKLRGNGYKKGNLKKETGNMKLQTRTTDPTTVYVKDSIHRDDIVDITDFDAVDYMYKAQRQALNEEIATAMLFGDGREDGDEDKIPEDKIRPIWTDDELFTIHKTVDVDKFKGELSAGDTVNLGNNFIAAEAFIEANLDARISYKGSGAPIMFAAPQTVNTMLMARDANGRRIYNSLEELKSANNVSEIVTIEQMNGLTRENTNGDTMELMAIIVNLNDYTLGATKGGEITRFNQFDIDFNKERFLIETRCSGALTKVKSAIALEKKIS